MHLDFLTVIPQLIAPVLDASVVGRAQAGGLFTWRAVNVRAFASGKHRITDEPPFGGGPGMVLKVEPMVRAIRWCSHAVPTDAAPPVDTGPHDAPADRAQDPLRRVILLDPGGAPFTQQVARRYATLRHLIFVCGRYEGVDERVRAHVDESLCVGDAILTGGELPALMAADAVLRLLPGVLGNPDSAVEESHETGLLEYPQYTRPREFEGVPVPDILMGGDHGKVARWRRQQSLVRTRLLRPELFAQLTLTDTDQRLLDDADGKPPPPKKKKRRVLPPTSDMG